MKYCIKDSGRVHVAMKYCIKDCRVHVSGYEVLYQRLKW